MAKIPNKKNTSIPQQNYRSPEQEAAYALELKKVGRRRHFLRLSRILLVLIGLPLALFGAIYMLGKDPEKLNKKNDIVNNKDEIESLLNLGEVERLENKIASLQDDINSNVLTLQLAGWKNRIALADKIIELNKNSESVNNAKVVKIRSLMAIVSLDAIHQLGAESYLQELESYCNKNLKSDNDQVRSKANVGLFAKHLVHYLSDNTDDNFLNVTNELEQLFLRMSPGDQVEEDLGTISRIIESSDREDHRLQLQQKLVKHLVQTDDPNLLLMATRLTDNLVRNQVNFEVLRSQIRQDSTASDKLSSVVAALSETPYASESVYRQVLWTIELVQVHDKSKAQELLNKLSNACKQIASADAQAVIEQRFLDYDVRTNLVGKKFDVKDEFVSDGRLHVVAFFDAASAPVDWFESLPKQDELFQFVLVCSEQIDQESIDLVRSLVPDTPLIIPPQSRNLLSQCPVHGKPYVIFLDAENVVVKTNIELDKVRSEIVNWTSKNRSSKND